MSTQKKSSIEKAAKSLEVEKLTENEAGQLAGGFSDALEAENLAEAGDINISKCHCTTTPTKPAEPK
ncbi:hypothetical protein [Chitinophaga filiformis]|uniref:Bacteriocin-type signal sequence-containing protein n=1 Tax=Chitinophaga filiformis TaxID=104663 RepID=A0ABY4I9R8_CHIFI|nr:hypothetical protein [Chitinophaga filiformis]UPK72099.1 hypothetical protein MYF79_12470 [Chitinophaga filiformis]